MAVVGFLDKRLLPNYKLHNKTVSGGEFQPLHNVTVESGVQSARRAR